MRSVASCHQPQHDLWLVLKLLVVATVITVVSLGAAAAFGQQVAPPDDAARPVLTIFGGPHDADFKAMVRACAHDPETKYIVSRCRLCIVSTHDPEYSYCRSGLCTALPCIQLKAADGTVVFEKPVRTVLKSPALLVKAFVKFCKRHPLCPKKRQQLQEQEQEVEVEPGEEFEPEEIAEEPVESEPVHDPIQHGDSVPWGPAGIFAAIFGGLGLALGVHKILKS